MSYLLAKIYVLALILYFVSTVVGIYEDPTEDFLTHAVVRPTIHPALKTNSHPKSTQSFSEEELTLEFGAFDKNFVIDLKVNKDLFSPDYEEVYQENGKEVVYQKTNEKERLCYYKGHVQNVKSSWAAISTCKGISGAVFDGEETYYIEPDQRSLTGEHLVFKASERKARNLKCGKNFLPNVVPRVTGGVSPSASSNDTKYIEVIIVNDNSMYQKYSSDLTKVNDRAKQVANIANTMYSSLNIVISLLKLKTWSFGDLITITKDYEQTLKNFLTYRKDTLTPSDPNDNALLLTNTRFNDGTIGLAYMRGICDSYYSGVEAVDNTVAAGEVGATFAHELGHNLGMDHDDELSIDCQCPDTYCIMYSTEVSVTPTNWSKCSKDSLETTLNSGKANCLNNKPANLNSF